MGRTESKTKLDRTALVTSLKRLAPVLKTLPNEPPGGAHLREDPARARSSLAALTKAVASLPGTLQDAFADREEPGPLELGLLMIAADALGKEPAASRKNLRLEYEDGVRFCFGDLHVKGSFEFGANTFVLGDLVVDGALSEVYHSVGLIVAGSIRARGIKCGGRIYAGKGIRAEVVYMELDGKLGGPAGIEADLVICENETVGLLGKVAAKTQIVLKYGDRKRPDLDQLRSILAPACFAVVGDDQELFNYTALLGALGKGKPWAAAGSARAKPSAKVSTGNKPNKVKASAPGVRYFELIGGGSRKFWEVRVHGKSFTTRYGKIGQAGQNTTKTFSTPAKAQTEADKLTLEKARKGYREHK